MLSFCMLTDVSFGAFPRASLLALFVDELLGTTSSNPNFGFQTISDA